MRVRNNAGRRWQISLTVLSIALFSAALTQPAFFFGQTAASSGPASRLLLEGWRGVPHGYFEWLANPVLLASWIMAFGGRHRGSVATAVLSLALMLAFLYRQMLQLPGGRPDTAIVSHGAGFWLWVGSALAMVIAGARPGAAITPLQ